MDNDSNDDLDVMFDDNQSGAEEAPKTPAEGAAQNSTEEKKDTEAATSGADKDATAGGEEKAAEAGEGAEAQGKPPVGEGEPAAPATPPAEPAKPETKPLTAEEVRQIIAERDDQTRSAAKAVDEEEQQILRTYYPQGLSNVLVDEKSGREIRTPQDVVELSGGEMTVEEAAQWLMNEQTKLDRSIADIKQSARELAETNYNFKEGATRVMTKYAPIFDKYPALQRKIYDGYMKQVKMDNEKDLILSAPDIEDYYATVMEPYVMAFNYSQKGATAPAAPAAPSAGQPKIPESKQTAADRLDITGDGGSGGGDNAPDPNDPEANLNKLFGE